MSWQDRCGPYIAVAELTDRGWTAAMIEQFLGEPDRTEPNPGGPRAPRVKLWFFSQVEEVEGQEAFQLRRQQAAARRRTQLKTPPAADAGAGSR